MQMAANFEIHGADAGPRIAQAVENARGCFVERQNGKSDERLHSALKLAVGDNLHLTCRLAIQEREPAPHRFLHCDDAGEGIGSPLVNPRHEAASEF